MIWISLVTTDSGAKLRLKQSPSKLDPYAEELTGRLRDNQRLIRMQRRAARQMHAAPAAKGYTGSSGRAAAFPMKIRVD